MNENICNNNIKVIFNNAFRDNRNPGGKILSRYKNITYN